MELKTIKSGVNSEDVQDMNRSLVISLLRRKKLCSRSELARATGLKKTTITNIIADLMEWGLVCETGKLEGDKGRRAVGIKLDAERFKVLSVRLARRFFSVALIDISGNLCEQTTVDIIPAHTPEQIMVKMREVIEGYINREQDYRILGVGMGAPGIILFREGRIACNKADFPGWERISIIKELTDRLSVPFFFDHDANAGALAEWKYGGYSRTDGTMVYISAGDGIGAGVVIDGRIQRGAQGFFGEIGHTSINYNGKPCGCGSRGCLDLYASGNRLMRDVKKRLPEHPQSVLNNEKKLDVGTIIAAMHKGDEFTRERISELCWFLGFGIINVINNFDPDVIIIGDELSSIGQMLLDTVREVVNEYTLPEISKNIRIELSEINEDPILLGAAAMALDKLLASPTALFAEGSYSSKIII